MLLLTGCEPRDKDKDKDKDTDNGSVTVRGCFTIKDWQKERLSQATSDVAVVLRNVTSQEPVAQYSVAKADTPCQTRPDGCPARGELKGLPYGKYVLSVERHTQEFRSSGLKRGMPETLGYYLAASGSGRNPRLVRTADSASVIVIDEKHREHVIEFELF
jgi:hypothetical protein